MSYINFYGFGVGVVVFFIIGIFHPIVIKTEYYFGRRIWWVFFVAGFLCSAISLFIKPFLGSTLLGVTGFNLFWATHEIFLQHKRVLRGQAKKNPERVYELPVLLLTVGTFPQLNFSGLIIGTATFVIILVSRYACIKGEYYFTKKFWIAFLLIGILSVTSALFTRNLLLSAILSVNGFSFFWGIGEIIEQEERVKKGWFPKRKEKNRK